MAINATVAKRADESDNERITAIERELAQARHILAVAPVLLYIYDVIEQRNIFANREIYDILGYTTTDVQALGNRVLSTLMHPEDFARFPAHLARLSQTSDGEILEFDYRMRHRDGLWRWFRSRDTIVSRLPDGTMQTIIGAVQDITERMYVQEAYQTLVDHSMQGLVIMQSHGPVFANPATSEIFGYSQEEILNATIDDVSNVLYPEDRVRAMNYFYDRLAGKPAASRYEVRIIRKDGNIRWIEIAATRINYRGKPASQVVHMDITERKQMEAALQQAKEQAEFANQAKSDFLAKLSHELRNPLSAVIGMTTLLLNTDLSDKQHEYIQTIRMSSDTLLTLANDILDFSRIEAGKLRLEYRPFHLRQCIEEALHTFYPRAAEKGLTLQYDIDEQTPLNLIGDATRIRQVLVNLVSNGIKFTEHGAVVVTAQVAEKSMQTETPALKSGSQSIALHLRVQDTGIGISKKYQDQLFQLFSQVHTNTTCEYGGVGLGLAICKQLVTLMNGKIWVESEAGKGATFHVIIELLLDRPHQHSASPSHMHRPRLDEQMGQRHPLRILVADDTLFIQKFSIELLARLGYRADIATNGEEVLKALRQFQYDVILMDVRMPGMDGIEATRRIRSEWPKKQQPRIIAVTAQAIEGDRERFLHAGMDDVLNKPILIEELVEKLEGVSPLPEQAFHSPHYLERMRQAEEPIDEAVYQQFASSLGSGSDSLLRELIDAYLMSAAEHVQTLQLHLQDSEATYPHKLFQSAHTLMGNSAQIGAMSLANRCKELEIVSRTGSMEHAALLVRNIASELERVKIVLESMKPGMRKDEVSASGE